MSSKKIGYGLSATSQSDEYVLVKKTNVESKETKEPTATDGEALEIKTEFVKPVSMKSGGGGSRAFGQARVCLVYDFTITPSTSAALSTSIALYPQQDTQFTDHWKYLYGECRMDKAEVILNFSKYVNLVGESGQLPAMNWAYKVDASSSTQTYSQVSDYTTSKPINWSSAKPVVSYQVTPKMLKTAYWTNGVEASTVGDFLGKWASCARIVSNACSMGWVHICTYDATGVASRAIIGKLKMWVTFRNKL